MLYGDPVQRARVLTARIAFVAGHRRMVSGKGFSPRFMDTDDRGQYRLFNVPPGRYILILIAMVNDPLAPVGTDLPGYG